MSSLTDGLNGVIGEAESILSSPTAAAIGGAVVGSAVTGAVALGIAASKKKNKKRNSKSKKRRTGRKIKNYKYARTARKRKDTSTKRIRMTKTGQPYIILASGKARFIKKSSARRSRKIKGGRY